MTKVTFLGYVVSQEEIYVDLAKIDAILHGRNQRM